MARRLIKHVTNKNGHRIEDKEMEVENEMHVYKSGGEEDPLHVYEQEKQKAIAEHDGTLAMEHIIRLQQAMSSGAEELVKTEKTADESSQPVEELEKPVNTTGQDETITDLTNLPVWEELERQMNS